MKRFYIILLLSSLLGMLSCNKGERDYEYRIINTTADSLYLSYTITSTNIETVTTLEPGGQLTAYIRENVSGDHIWDIETASQIYPFTKLDGRVIRDDGEHFTDSLKLRRKWEGPEDGGGFGIYNLYVKDEDFCMSYQRYIAEIKNGSSHYNLMFGVRRNESQIDSVVVEPGNSVMYAGWLVIGKDVIDLYDSNKSGNIGADQVVSITFFDDEESLQGNRFNVNAVKNWTFISQESYGLYTQVIDESVCY